MHVLVIGRHALLVKALRRGLEEEGYTVDVAPCDPEGGRQAAAGGYDAIVLDLPRVEQDGLVLVRGWREAGLTTPVLALTGTNAPDGLDPTTDAWLTKPFALDELLTRLKSLVRAG
jgi:DNA-binding response OmpR family regulator